MLRAEAFANLGKPLIQLLSVWASAIVLVFVTRRSLRSGIKRALLDRDKAADSTRRIQRGEALISVGNSSVLVIAVVVAAIMSLGVIGLDLTPLVASVGVFGLAIGLGAQRLVQDFISGILMLIEDQFGVGDIIDVGEAAGSVETVSLRTTRIRALNGTLWHIPNSEIRRVGNMSQQWARAVVDLSVSYESKYDDVVKSLDSAIDILMENEETMAALVERPTVLGIERFAGSSVDIRVLLMTKPANQWMIAREFRKAVKLCFDRDKIEFPFPQLTISQK